LDFFKNRFILLWLRFAELGRTKIIADPSAFDVDEEFFKMNPQISKEEFIDFLWKRYSSGKKYYLNSRN
jgi:hypothetical protein